MPQGNIPIIVNVLARMGKGIGIIEAAITVIDDFHAALDALVAHDGVTAYLNPDDGQVGRVQFHADVIGREISHNRLVTCPQDKRHHHQQYRSQQQFHRHDIDITPQNYKKTRKNQKLVKCEQKVAYYNFLW